MKTAISERLQLLRKQMQHEHLSAFIFPSTDPHQSEIVPYHWAAREWITGFDGSAGTAVVTLNSAALWTDSRYFLAAADQLGGTEFQLMKAGLADTPSITAWLARELRELDGPEIGIDGMVGSCAEVETLIAEMREHGGITVRTNYDPLRQIWTDRPEIPLNPVVLHPLRYAGEDTASKLQRIRQALRRQHADGMLVCALDDIAWTLNLRGSDIPCNPLFVSYLLISSTTTTLFIDPRKLPTEVEDYLRSIHVDVAPYEKVQDGLSHYFEYNILIDPTEVNYTLSRAVKCQAVVRSESPIPYLKAVKNDTEIAGFRQAMKRDGIAMVKFLQWLETAVAAGGQTEMTVSDRLEQFRAEQPLYKGASFPTISAYEAHGAIVHYEPTPATDMPLEPRGFLLLDSGAQYADGTTDITRTIPLGPISDQQRHIYTLVLKAHIQLELCKFPDGASGTRIDAVARQPLWREGLNFMHGTGHGVGSYLCVHEGPHQVRQEYKSAPLHTGMTVTDEPGIYLAGKFGVRIENTLIVEDYLKTDMGSFLQMDSLTLCPIDLTAADLSLLTDEELAWLNTYHQRVYDELSPYLDESEKAWLRAYISVGK